MTAARSGLTRASLAAALLMATIDGQAAGDAREGRAIALDPTRGNCPACHLIAGSEAPGDLGPPLVGMKSRFPDARRLREQIWDPMENNPSSRMPPFGRHRILTEAEIDKIVEFVYSL